MICSKQYPKLILTGQNWKSLVIISFVHPVQMCHWFFPHIVRPANVPEGAHIQWEIELLGFEMPKVISKVIFSSKLSLKLM